MKLGFVSAILPELSLDEVFDVAKAEDFIAPRVLPVKDDPDYGALTCEAPVSGVPNVVPPAGEAPPDLNAPPSEGAPAVPAVAPPAPA